MSSAPTDDSQLLFLARRALDDDGFSVQEGTIPGTDNAWLLAENELFVLAVTAGLSVDDLLLLEAFAAPALSDLLRGEHIGAKRWDAHLVLLAAEHADERGSSQVVELEHNTRSLRRVVGLGVRTDRQGVRRALSPFLALPEPGEYVLTPPLDELREQLVLQGVTRAIAEAAVAAYEENGSLDAL